MKTKIILPLILTIMSGIRLMSQTPVTPREPAMGKCSFGVYGGVNFQNINGKDMSGNKLGNTILPKVHIGINEQIPVAPEFFVQVGLQYAAKGARGNVMYSNVLERRQLDLNYFEIPIQLLYKPLVGRGHFLLGFGPYIGYAFTGEAKFTGEVYNVDQKISYAKTINVVNPNDQASFRHFDAGANAFFGYEFANHLNLVFDAQLGLVNINSKNTYYPDSKLSEMNTGFGLSVGYRF